MNILFCDDDRKRFELFSKKFADHNIIFETTAKLAIELITEPELLHNFQHFDMISLDHDFLNGGEINQYFCNKYCGCYIARFLAARYQHSEFKPNIVIHTSNRYAGYKMSLILFEAGIESRYSEFED